MSERFPVLSLPYSGARLSIDSIFLENFLLAFSNSSSGMVLDLLPLVEDLVGLRDDLLVIPFIKDIVSH